jgi:hypothetical protein
VLLLLLLVVDLSWVQLDFAAATPVALLQSTCFGLQIVA